MIIKEYQLNEVIKKGSYPSFLLVFGPNEGLIRDDILKISSSFKENLETDEITINGKAIEENHSLIDEEVRSFSMFSEKKIIHIEHLKDKHLQYFENQEIENNQILVIIKSDNLGKSSKIRNFFEKHKKYAAIACYEDDIRSTMNLFSQFQSDHKIKFNSDIKNYLIQNLSTDRLISKNELEKILLVISHKENEQIKLEDIQAILNDSSSNSLNIINEYVMYGKGQPSLKKFI
jgi:DNA polymerase-3 subunit delta